MKNIFLTLVAVAFGTCISFAQSSPKKDLAASEDNSVYTLTLDRMSNKLEEAERRNISVQALPETVVEQLKYSELAAHTILSATEVQPLAGGKEDVLYELVLQDNVSSSSAAAPVLLVRFDTYGELVFQQEASSLAIKE